MRFVLPVLSLASILLGGCGSDPASTDGGPDGGSGTDTGTPGVDTGTSPPVDAGGGAKLGDPHEGGEFHLGPVDWDETKWHNACAPGTKYATPVRKAEGQLLAGLWNGIPNVAGYCDACIAVKTAKGKTAVLRVVTYGDTTPNSIDVSPEAYAILDSGEYPRTMTWWFAECPASGNVMYEFQTGSNEWWTSLWVRNARLPLAKVEVKSKNHGAYVALTRGGDGTLTDGGGFGKGPFTLRLTSIDGKVIEESFDWPAAGIAGAFLTGKANF